MQAGFHPQSAAPGAMDASGAFAHFGAPTICATPTWDDEGNSGIARPLWS